MSFEKRYTITQTHLPMPSNRRCGWPLPYGVRYIVAHDTGNPGTTARQNVGYYSRSPRESASAHVFVDDREIIECIPAFCDAPEKAWHVRYGVDNDSHMFGYNANDAALGIEYCYGGAIDADQAYLRYVWVIAYCCDLFHLDPARSVVGHFMLDPARKTDPLTGLAQSRRTYEQLLRDVVSVYGECQGRESPMPDARAQIALVTTTCHLNVRSTGPHRRAAVVRTVGPGTTLSVAAVVEDGEPVNGNPVWYRDTDGHYFWSGGAKSAARDPWPGNDLAAGTD